LSLQFAFVQTRLGVARLDFPGQPSIELFCLPPRNAWLHELKKVATPGIPFKIGDRVLQLVDTYGSDGRSSWSFSAGASRLENSKLRPARIDADP